MLSYEKLVSNCDLKSTNDSILHDLVEEARDVKENGITYY
jgi:hypothetical protein